MPTQTYYEKVKKILIIILFLNVSVAFIKLGYGWYADSLSIISDGFHSLFDSVSNIIGIIGIILASKPPDAEHQYGHGKFETIASLGIGVLLVFTCFEILKSAIERFFNPTAPDITTISFIVMGVTMLINIGVSWYENKQGKKLNSSILISDSLHTRSDIYATIAVIFGFIAIKLGYVIADPIIAILIVILIARTGINIIKNSSDILLDKAPVDIDLIKKIVNSVETVNNCHKIRARGSSSNIYIDLHIELESCMSLNDAHLVSHEVESKLKSSISGVKDVVVHVDPCEEP